MAHADAVGAFVPTWCRGEIVVELVQTTDEGFVTTGALGGEFAIAEIHLAPVIDADVGALQGGRSIAGTPDPVAQLDVTKGDRFFAAVVAVMPLVHRTADEGQAAAIAIGVLLPVPPFKEIELHLAGIEIQRVDVLIRQITEAVAHHRGKQLCITPSRRLLLLGAGWRDRNQKGEPSDGHPEGAPHQPSPGARCAGLWSRSLCTLIQARRNLRGRCGRTFGSGSTVSSATTHCSDDLSAGNPPVKQPKAGKTSRGIDLTSEKQGNRI